MSQIASWRSRLLSIHPDHLRIARSAVWVSLFALIGKCAGAFKEMAIAYRYGISNVVDAYQLSLTAITWLPATLVAAVTLVLVPALVSMRMKRSEERARFLGELDVIAVIIGALFAALLYFSWPYALTFIGGKLSDETRALSRQMMLGMWPIGILMLLISVHAARLQARERHVNTLLECVPAVCLLAFVLGWHNEHSTLPLVVGSTLGFLAQAIILMMLSRKADGVRPRLSLSMKSPEWPMMYRAIGVFMIGQVIMSLATPLDQYFVAGLGDGAIATLGYANRVIALLVSMGAMAISRATMPVLSEILNNGDHARARSVALKWSIIMLAIGCAVVVVAWLLAPFGVAVLFQRGAFTAADTAAVAHLLRWGLLQVPCYFSTLVLVGMLASEGRYREMAYIAVANFIVKAIANFVLIRYFHIAGVMMATAIMCTSAFLCYFYLTWSSRPANSTGAA